MTPTIQSLGLDKLPREDRLAIARALYDSVSAEGLRHSVGTGQGGSSGSVAFMKLPIRFGNRARAEYYEAILWYESERPGLGIEFEAEVEALLAVVSKQPDRFPLTVRGSREAPVDRFPYCVYYRVRPDRVFVLGLFHQSRDSQEWQSR